MYGEHNASQLLSINGSNIDAAYHSTMNFSDDGNGLHVMKGDQAFMTQEGGEHHGVDVDYTVTAANGCISLDSKLDLSLHSNTNIGIKCDANGSIHTVQELYISSGQSIT